MPPSFGHAPGEIVLLHWFLKDDNAYLQVYGAGKGGVQEIDDTAILRGQLPNTGFHKYLEYLLPTGDFRKVFYVKGKDTRKSAIFSINLLYDNQSGIAYATYYTHSMQRKKDSGETSAPIETCGGVLSRSPDGYYATLNNAFLKYLGAGSHSIQNERNYRAKLLIAADPDTSMEWIRENIHDRRLALAALDNNGDMGERIDYLYRIALVNIWDEVINKIAEDHWTSETILSEIYDKKGELFINRLVHNPATGNILLNRMLDHIGKQTMNNPGADLLPYASHPKASMKTLERILDIYEMHMQSAGVPDAVRRVYPTFIDHMLNRKDLTNKLLERLAKMIPNYDYAYIYYRMVLTHPNTDDALKRQMRDDLSVNTNRLERTRGYEPKKLKQLLADAVDNNIKLDNQTFSSGKNMRGSKLKPHRSIKETASDPETSPEILQRLFSESEDGEILEHLAANPSTPRDILNRISDGDYVITKNLYAQKYYPKLLFCNPTVDKETKRHLPYLMNVNCKTTK
jgi:hypothetical protein